MSRKGLESNGVEDANACEGRQSAVVLEPWQAGELIQRTPAAKRLLRVLVADDSRDTTDSLSMLVQMWGHDVRRAYDGVSALEMTAAYPPDVLVLDIHMPKMNGCHLAQQLRRQRRFKDTLLIAMTGWADEVHRRMCEEAGFDLFLIKPMEPSNLETLLLLERERLADAPEAPCPSPRKFGILIVDDEEYMRDVLSVWLRQQGFAVWPAADGREALELYRRHQEVIDLALLDVRMPGLDGPSTLAGLREINPQVHSCFMSGHLGNYTEEKLLSLGAATVLPKPFRWAEVMQVLWELAKKAYLSRVQSVSGYPPAIEREASFYGAR